MLDRKRKGIFHRGPPISIRLIFFSPKQFASPAARSYSSSCGKPAEKPMNLYCVHVPFPFPVCKSFKDLRFTRCQESSDGIPVGGWCLS